MKIEKYHIAEDIKNNPARPGFKSQADIQFKTVPAILIKNSNKKDCYV